MTIKNTGIDIEDSRSVIIETTADIKATESFVNRQISIKDIGSDIKYTETDIKRKGTYIIDAGTDTKKKHLWKTKKYKALYP